MVSGLGGNSHSTEYLVIGQIVAPRGVRGELKVRCESEDPQRFLSLKEVFLGEGRARFAVRAVRFFKGQILLQLHGIEDRNEAERWRDAYVQIPIEEGLPLGENEYYYHQIEGLTAVTEEGEVLGQVVEILPTGANDVYVVRGEREEILLPAIREVILRVDLEKGLLVVHLLEGLRGE
ncbi:MAG: 16S rRNA processing protein RimM [Chloroflexi bacterium]|nr:16S rRNA processing protein RimM [Chloroflexota bacterium]